MPWIALRDGEKMHYRDIGRGRPCLLLHGFAMNASHWLPFVLPLSRQYRFILPDMRGFGRSHEIRFNQDCVLTNYAEDIADLIEALDLHDISLGGISMGAFVALQYMGIHGTDRVARYAHMDQAPRAMNTEDWLHGLFGPDHEPRVGQLRVLLNQALALPDGTGYFDIPKMLRREMLAAFGDFSASAVSRPWHKRALQRIWRIERMATRMLPFKNWRAYIEVMRAYLEKEYDMRPHLAGIDVPVTVMVGMRSDMYPHQGQAVVHEMLPNSKLVRFWNSGHALPLEQPSKFIKELRGFLST